jgi:hypothetical protein
VEEQWSKPITHERRWWEKLDDALQCFKGIPDRVEEAADLATFCF